MFHFLYNCLDTRVKDIDQDVLIVRSLILFKCLDSLMSRG